MEQILDYLMMYAPAIIAILSEVAVVATLIAKVRAYFKKADDSIKELRESTEYQNLKNQMSVVLQENIELKKKLNIVLEKLTKVKVTDETNTNNKEE